MAEGFAQEKILVRVDQARVRPIKAAEDLGADGPECAGSEPEFHGRITVEIGAFQERNTAKPWGAPNPIEDIAVAPPEGVNPAPHRDLRGMLDFEREALKPVGSGEMSVIVAPDHPTGGKRLLAEHAVHERVFENVVGFDEQIDIAVLVGVLLEQAQGGGFNFVQAGAQKEKSRVGIMEK